MHGFLPLVACKLHRVFFSQRLALLAIFLSTFVFSLMWQFNQFMMLVQALGLFALDALDMLPALKVSAEGRSVQRVLGQCPCCRRGRRSRAHPAATLLPVRGRYRWRL